MKIASGLHSFTSKRPLRCLSRKMMKELFGCAKVAKGSARFIAKRLGVPDCDISIKDGKVYVTREAYDEISEQMLAETGGLVRHVYEFAEMAFNDIYTGTVQASGGKPEHFMRRAGQVVGDKLKKVGGCLTQVGEFIGPTVVSGLGLLGAGAVGIWLCKLGARQMAQAKNDVTKEGGDLAWNGLRSFFLGSEALAASVSFASNLAHGTFAEGLGQAAGSAAKAVALPLAWTHGIIDVGQGLTHIVQGTQEKSKLKIVEGLAEIGMGVGWLAAAYGATPVIVVGSCVCLATKIGVGMVRSYKERQAEKEAASSEETPPQKTAAIIPMRLAPGPGGDSVAGANRPE